MKLSIVAVGIVALLAGCAPSAVEEPVAPAMAADPASPLSAPGYMAMAASSDMFEIQSSQLALQMSRNPAVQQFAQMMVGDHSRTTQNMMAVAQQVGLSPPPPQMMPHHAEMLERLRTAGPDFDSAYKREQIAAHQEALNLHRNYAAQGDNPAFRTLAQQTVPIIEAHYGHAQSLPEAMMPPEPAPLPPQPAGERG
jgi:putative membrane protein